MILWLLEVNKILVVERLKLEDHDMTQIAAEAAQIGGRDGHFLDKYCAGVCGTSHRQRQSSRFRLRRSGASPAHAFPKVSNTPIQVCPCGVTKPRSQAGAPWPYEAHQRTSTVGLSQDPACHKSGTGPSSKWHEFVVGWFRGRL
jgi:hypothetical protein